jgi:hypothetical protein
MLSSLERGFRVRVMKVVRRGDMNDVDPLVGKHRLHRLVRGGQAGGAGTLIAPGAARADDAMDLDAKPAQGVHMDGADETSADHGGANLAQR